MDKYRLAVFSDGSEARFICPLDELFWENHLIKIAEYISNISKRSSVSIDGLFLDMEMYRTEDLSNNKRYYSQKTCYCKHCFEKFLSERHMLSADISSIAPSERNDYLIDKGLEDAYRAFLFANIKKLASHYRTAVHKINPNLFLSVYPYPYENNWVINSVVEAFGTNNKPVLLFAVDTYYKGGHERIPQAYGDAYEAAGIEALYIPGYLFRKYSSDALHENLIHSLAKADGYWLYRLPQLWTQPTVKNDTIAKGTADDYWKAIKGANILNPIRSLRLAE
jgi:hypothetical protein